MELFADGPYIRVMKFLGELLNCTLTWGAHIAHICAKVSHSWTYTLAFVIVSS